ncbi:MAG TPA: PDC sensor domain-containing protein [Acidobacteriota bacterium]|jgi:sensor histidine kinase regulating citrate/malate metabolism
MRGFYKVSSLLFCLVVLFSSAAQSENIPPKLQQEIDKTEKYAKDETVIHAVQTQNQRRVSMDEILKMDRDWIRGTISEDLVKSLMDNHCALKMKELANEIQSSMEAFVMDDQGVLVCMTQRTSDYWQGDEPKWIDSFKGGAGETVVSKREYDQSTKSTLVHVSVPIMDEQKAIGVLCIGINLTKLAEE